VRVKVGEGPGVIVDVSVVVRLGVGVSVSVAVPVGGTGVLGSGVMVVLGVDEGSVAVTVTVPELVAEGVAEMRTSKISSTACWQPVNNRRSPAAARMIETIWIFLMGTGLFTL
jgi:hypothetical protein